MKKTSAAKIANVSPTPTKEQADCFKRLSTEFEIPLSMMTDYAEGQRRFLVALHTNKRKTMMAQMKLMVQNVVPMTEIMGAAGMKANSDVIHLLKADRKRITDLSRKILDVMDPTK